VELPALDAHSLDLEPADMAWQTVSGRQGITEFEQLTGGNIPIISQ